MEREPSEVELEIALSRMKTKKKPGRDKVTVEVLRYGGEKLREMVFKVVKEMWMGAAAAGEGREADEWPEEWKIGITVPLW